MQIFGEKDTIAAVATPPGQGGIGVVRISGPEAKRVLAGVWAGQTGVYEFESHKLYYGPVKKDGALIDRVLVSWMKAPRSYTGEDVVEISGHGGPVVMKRILEACCDGGARLAYPGEFTKRAFLNRRMDLVQAEAVADVISASNDEGMKSAQEQLEGRLSRRITQLNGRLTELRALVEASIDFPEEDVEFIENAGIKDRLRSIIDDASRLSLTFEDGRLLRDGVRVVIAGRPNAGKSSLFNSLIGSSRAIVHHQPGTTRDVVEQSIGLGGLTFHLRDTAGLGKAGCEVEGMGISRAREELEQADMVIYVIDATVDMTKQDEEALSKLGPRRIVVYNKADLLDVAAREDDKLLVSATDGDGLDDLREEMLRAMRTKETTETGGVIVTNLRHKLALDDAVKAVNDALVAVEKGEPVECAAHHLRSAQEGLGNITGETFDEAILDEIFSKFCIGK
jgi:tRNA modification GTPase